MKPRRRNLIRLAALLIVAGLIFCLLHWPTITLLAVIAVGTTTTTTLLLIACCRLKGIDVYRWWTDIWVVAAKQARDTGPFFLNQ